MIVRTILRRSLSPATLFAAALILGGCFNSDDDSDSTTGPGGGSGGGTEITIPASWAGAYQITSNDSERGGTGDNFIDMLCAGEDLLEIFDVFDEEDTGLVFDDVTCTGSWGDAAIDVSCSGTAVNGVCEITQNLDVTAARSGEMFTGTMNVSQTVTTVDGSPAECVWDEQPFTSSFSGTRIDGIVLACADIGETVPSDWAGDWSIAMTESDCDGTWRSGGGEEEIVSFCPGASVLTIFQDDPSQDDFDTWGGMTNSDLDVFFTFEDLNSSCDRHSAVRVQATRSGDTFSGTFTEYTYIFGDGECASETICSTGTVEGSRVSANASDCGGERSTTSTLLSSILGNR